MNIHDCHWFDLAAVGNVYIRKHLRMGLTLSQAVADAVDLSKGSVVTAQPVGTDLGRLTQLEYGGIDGRAMWEWLVDAVESHLAADNRHLIVCENYYARPHHPYVSRFTSRVILFEEEMYHVMTSDRYSPEQLGEAMHDASSRAQLLFMTSAPPRFGPRRRRFNRADVEFLARNTLRIVARAYDDEGFVMWQPTSK